MISSSHVSALLEVVSVSVVWLPDCQIMLLLIGFPACYDAVQRSANTSGVQHSQQTQVLYNCQQPQVAAMKLLVTACREAEAFLRQVVEKHLRRDSLNDVLDLCAGIWPLQPTRHFADLALR